MENWHLLEKELPPNPGICKRDDYLCTVSGEVSVIHLQYGSYTFHYGFNGCNTSEEWLRNGKPYNREIIAWMPFPKPYR